MTDRPRLLYLLTDEISSVLVRGQLGFLAGEGFDVTAGCRLVDPGRPAEGAWDDGVEVRHVPFVREPSPLADLQGLWSTARLVRSVRPDIVNASTPKAGLLGMLAGWLCRVPTRVYVVRGLRFETASGWRRRLFAGTERLAMRLAHHVVFNSASLRAVAEREGLIAEGRGEVLANGSGNGIDLARFAPEALPTTAEARHRLGVPDGPETVVVGFVGRFTRDKGIEALVEVFVRLHADRPHLHLLLVGQFEDGDPIDAGVRRSVGEDRAITVVPWLDDTAVAYRAIDVLAFPSHREGLPNVPIEAQLCGVPVVGYAATGTVDAVRDGETGMLVEVGDETALAGVLTAIVDDEALRDTLGAAGPAWVARAFDRQRLWREWSDRYLDWAGATPRVLPLRQGDLEIAEFDDEFVVYDPRCNEVHTLSGMAAIVFDACDGVTRRDQLLDEVVGAGIDDDLAAEAVNAALEALRAAGLLAGSEPHSTPP